MAELAYEYLDKMVQELVAASTAVEMGQSLPVEQVRANFTMAQKIQAGVADEALKTAMQAVIDNLHQALEAADELAALHRAKREN